MDWYLGLSAERRRLACEAAGVGLGLHAPSIEKDFWICWTLLARHYYDLWCLIRAGVGARAMADVELFRRVAAHRGVFFRKRREAQDTLAHGKLRLLPRAEVRSAWKRDYEAMRESMLFGDVPDFDEVLEAVHGFESAFNARASG